MRRANDPTPDRRQGPSRLSQWSRRRITSLWLVWPAIVLMILAAAVALSVVTQHGFVEVRIAISRVNAIMLLAVLLLPPGGLTLVWRRMRGRRRSES